MLQPLDHYVVLSIEKEEKTTASGIILTTDAKDKPAFGKILAVGPKVDNLSTGDVVVYQTYSGTNVKLDGQDYLLIKAENILAKVTK